MLSERLTSSDLASLAQQAAALLASDVEAAQRLARRILAAAPGDPRGRLVLASALRRKGQHEAAASILERLVRQYPQAANSQYELGMALAGLRRAEAAEAALRQCLTLAPDHAEALAAFADLLFRRGADALAKTAATRARRLRIRDPMVGAAFERLAQGDAPAALALLQDRLAAAPDDGEALALLGEMALDSGRFADAERHLDRACAQRPRDERIWLQLAVSRLRQQKIAAAAPLIERLLAAHPAAPAYRNLQAALLGLMGDDAGALALYEGLLNEMPDQPQVWLNYAQALKTVGRRADAEAAYRACLAIAPASGEAYWQLANTKVAVFDDADVATLTALAHRDDLPAADTVNVRYALGKAYEDRGEPSAAFRHYAAGAALRRAAIDYRAAETTAFVTACVQRLTREAFAARPDGGAASDAPVFVVGLPRSGSTLVEQILASHASVEGTMELPDIGLLARSLAEIRADGSYLEALLAASAEERTALGQSYLDSTAVHRRLGRARFVDKMPNNFLHTGLIALILPNARIIDVRRHPMATGFSGFKQHFAQGQLFSYDLADIGAYYRDYVRLMRHFDEVLPGRVHRVIYEDLVEDTEAEVRRLLDHCGLTFEPACLDFHRNTRAVRTVSSEQVRQPIYRSGLDQWRKFEPWLGPLRAALGDAFESWRT